MGRSRCRRRCTATLERNGLADFLKQLSGALAPFPARKKYLIGVSGGRDSTALLFALHELGYRKLVVCHLDHMLRGGEAERDAQWVERRAARLGLSLEMGQADVMAYARRKKLSVETAARDLRHAFFSACAREHRCPRLFLAHHAGDQVETCFLNFLRGSGTAGLGGMKPVSRISGLEILRPMLGIPRADITGYLTKRRISFREDHSNASLLPARNRLRHRVLPSVEKMFGPAFRNAILRSAEILRTEEAWMESLVPKAAEFLDCKDLRTWPLALQRRAVLRWLRHHAIADPGFAETERVLSLLDLRGPAKINLPGNRHARRRAGKIFLE